MEKAEISKGLSDRCLAGSSELDLNDAGTGEKSDTRLTQPRSVDVRAIRKQLDALRVEHGADTPVGHRCSNLMGQIDNLPPAPKDWIGYLMPDSVPQQYGDLSRAIEAQMTDLKRLMGAASYAGTP